MNDLDLDLSTDGPASMLIGRDELRYDFQGAKFRLPEDAKLLGWIFDQFLFGEVTGIQCGYWLYRAPSVEAASFFARQAVEELGHVRAIMKIYDHLGVRPGPAHPVVRFMAHGSMGADYAEHVALEMAVGEGLVLQIFYALIDTIDHPGVVRILESAVKQEERHVGFGERQTMDVLARHPEYRKRLLGLSLLSVEGVRRLAGWMKSRLDLSHPVLAELEPFLAHTVRLAELRLVRMGLLDRPLADYSGAKRVSMIAGAQVRHWLAQLKPAPKLLTDTYLKDPAVEPAPAEAAARSSGAPDRAGPA